MLRVSLSAQRSMALTVVLAPFLEACPRDPELSLSIRAFASLLPLKTFCVRAYEQKIDLLSELMMFATSE